MHLSIDKSLPNQFGVSKTLLYIAIHIIPFTLGIVAQAQILPPDRRVNWQDAGLVEDFPDTENTLSILDYGGDNEGEAASDEALRQAIDDLNGQFGMILFPQGTYVFNETIQLTDSILLKGEGADRTILQFDLGGKGHLINIQGMVTDKYEVAGSAVFGANQILLNNTEGLKTGDLIRIYQDDDALIASDWARSSTGQITQIVELAGQGIITLSDPLRMDYKLELKPAIEKVQPVRGVGISCLKIERNDATTSQTSNIHFRYAAGCRVQGVESDRCNFSHVTMSYSYRIKISGSYFHHGFSYGGGGKAYGVTAQFSSGNCLIENNIFENLRHAMLLQAGANGNVFAYNYSTDPFWEETLSPSDAAGDLVLHGNYPYANLFEGNIGQNLIIDNSHEINGPINTFFRNRAELYGFIMFPDPASDKQNIIGNEITSPEAPRGNFITFGNDHLIHGNRLRDEIIPENTSILNDTSYYLLEKPDFLGDFPWPALGLPLQANFLSIPAKNRHLSGGALALCGSEKPLITGFKEDGFSGPKYSVYPNPNRGVFSIDLGSKPNLPVNIKVFNILGRTVFEHATVEKLSRVKLNDQPPGLYFIKIFSPKKPAATLKITLY